MASGIEGGNIDYSFERIRRGRMISNRIGHLLLALPLLYVTLRVAFGTPVRKDRKDVLVPFQPRNRFGVRR